MFKNAKSFCFNSTEIEYPLIISIFLTNEKFGSRGTICKYCTSSENLAVVFTAVGFSKQ
jgi:hypothetical protein